jgi:hypothetical protein
MVRARIVAALVAVTQAGCSLTFMPRPPRGGERCADVGSLALPVLDGAVGVAALGFGALRTADPQCDLARPCESGEKDWSALLFGALVAAPFIVSSTLGFIWRHECGKREPPPRPAATDLDEEG